MILAIMLGLAATTQAAPPSPPPGDDIVVIGERMKNLRIVMVRDRRTGTRRCVTRPSSGDRILDAGVCDTYLGCVRQVDTAPALEACMRPPLTELVKSWQERRIIRARPGDPR
ncbi:MAG: hypothetical protein B7Z33_14085 [Sphingomonadales bacterium 12-68-11]|nr:MAG: hypothetical protein B7Z33_14085 [Sphingomonadales bacterium 12-68-11]